MTPQCFYNFSFAKGDCQMMTNPAMNQNTFWNMNSCWNAIWWCVVRLFDHMLISRTKTGISRPVLIHTNWEITSGKHSWSWLVSPHYAVSTMLMRNKHTINPADILDGFLMQINPFCIPRHFTQSMKNASSDACRANITLVSAVAWRYVYLLRKEIAPLQFDCFG